MKSRDFPRQISNSNRDRASKAMSTPYTPYCTDANCPASRGVWGEYLGQCRAVQSLQSVLQSTYGHAEFRPGQLEATLAALHGHDVFVRMSTGAGKSLCMFLPPLAVSDLSMGVVVSPLNCLMDEQVSLYKLY